MWQGRGLRPLCFPQIHSRSERGAESRLGPRLRRCLQRPSREECPFAPPPTLSFLTASRVTDMGPGSGGRSRSLRATNKAAGCTVHPDWTLACTLPGALVPPASPEYASDGILQEALYFHFHFSEKPALWCSHAPRWFPHPWEEPS